MRTQSLAHDPGQSTPPDLDILMRTVGWTVCPLPDFEDSAILPTKPIVQCVVGAWLSLDLHIYPGGALA